METDFNSDREKFGLKCASKKVIKLKAFYIHTFIFVTGLVVFILKEYYGAPLNFFPFNYLNDVVMVIWSCVFLIDAIDLFTSFKIFGVQWEERKMKSILEKKSKKQKWE